MTLTDDRTGGAAGATSTGAALRVWTSITLGLCAPAVAVGALEARLPLGPGNAAVHHGYPFFATGLALVLTVVAHHSVRRAPRWAGFVGALGTGYAVNALLIALLSYAVTTEGSALPVGLIGWLADVFFPICDIGLLGLAVGLLPDVRPHGRHRIAVGVLVGLTGATILAEAFLPHTLDSTTVANPAAVDALAPWTPALQMLVPVMFLYAVLLSVVRGIVLARESSRRGAGVGTSAWAAGVALLVTFVGQAAVPESNAYGAGLVVLVGGSAAAVLAARVAGRLSETRPMPTDQRRGA